MPSCLAIETVQLLFVFFYYSNNSPVFLFAVPQVIKLHQRISQLKIKVIPKLQNFYRVCTTSSIPGELLEIYNFLAGPWNTSGKLFHKCLLREISQLRQMEVEHRLKTKDYFDDLNLMYSFRLNCEASR